MAARNKAIAILMQDASDPDNPVLVKREQEYSSALGSADVELTLSSALEVVAIYNVRDLDGDVGGPFWDEFSGNSAYRTYGVLEGVEFAKQDLVGGGQGVYKRIYYSNATAPGSFIKVAQAFESIEMALGAFWTTYLGGDGTDYDTALAAARTLAGVPT